MCVFNNFHDRGFFEKSVNATFFAFIPKKIGQLERSKEYQLGG
jgi:hypothetical protein